MIEAASSAAAAARIAVLTIAAFVVWLLPVGIVSAADKVLHGGRIITLDQRSTIAEAIAIEGDRIVATGTSAAMLARAHPGTQRIDLAGRTVIPGLIDSHIHAIRAGTRFATEVSWIGATSIEEALERIQAAAAASKPGPSKPDTWVVVGGGWTPAQFIDGRRPTLAEITAAAPGRAIYVQLFYRAVLLSPEARAALGLEAEASLPAGAKLDLGEDGRPNGWISGTSAAITGLYDRLPKPPLAESMAGTQRFFRELNRLGVTGVIDPGGHNLQPEDYAALLALWRKDGLTVRVAYSISAPQAGRELADYETLTRFLPMGVGDGMLRFNGIGERVTWGMFNNETPNDAQIAEFERVARWAAANGMTLTAHWNNDRSVHHLLDIFERVNRDTTIRDLRWSIAHLHDASDLSLERMRALGVGWLMQNGMHFAAANFLATRGAAINRSPPIKSALRLGVRVGGGTDAHRVMSYNPFVSLKWMTDGRTVDGLPTRGAGELVTREAALRLYTQGSAWFAFDETRRGTLEPGRLADLAVLDADYFTVPAEALPRLQSLLTLVGGRIVHAGGPYEKLTLQRP